MNMHIVHTTRTLQVILENFLLYTYTHKIISYCISLCKCNYSLFHKQVPQKDLELASQSLVKALMIREKYMAMSQQSFPLITARFLQSLENKEEFQGMVEGINLADKKALSGNYESI